MGEKSFAEKINRENKRIREKEFKIEQKINHLEKTLNVKQTLIDQQNEVFQKLKNCEYQKEIFEDENISLKYKLKQNEIKIKEQLKQNDEKSKQEKNKLKLLHLQDKKLSQLHEKHMSELNALAAEIKDAQKEMSLHRDMYDNLISHLEYEYFLFLEYVQND